MTSPANTLVDASANASADASANVPANIPAGAPVPTDAPVTIDVSVPVNCPASVNASIPGPASSFALPEIKTIFGTCYPTNLQEVCKLSKIIEKATEELKILVELLYKYQEIIDTSNKKLDFMLSNGLPFNEVNIKIENNNRQMHELNQKIQRLKRKTGLQLMKINPTEYLLEVIKNQLENCESCSKIYISIIDEIFRTNKSTVLLFNCKNESYGTTNHLLKYSDGTNNYVLMYDDYMQDFELPFGKYNVQLTNPLFKGFQLVCRRQLNCEMTISLELI